MIGHKKPLGKSMIGHKKPLEMGMMGHKTPLSHLSKVVDLTNNLEQNKKSGGLERAQRKLGSMNLGQYA